MSVVDQPIATANGYARPIVQNGGSGAWENPELVTQIETTDIEQSQTDECLPDPRDSLRFRWDNNQPK